MISPADVPVEAGGGAEGRAGGPHQAGPGLDLVKLVDLRPLSRPPQFAGRDSDWEPFCFKFESWCSLPGLAVAPLMREAATHHAPITLDNLGEAQKQQAAVLYHLLIQLCAGKALSLIRLVEPANGLEAWRQLKAEYQADSSERLRAVLQGLITPTWTASLGFLEQLANWERACAEFGLASKQPIPDNITVGVVCGTAPAGIKAT